MALEGTHPDMGVKLSVALARCANRSSNRQGMCGRLWKGYKIARERTANPNDERGHPLKGAGTSKSLEIQEPET